MNKKIKVPTGKIKDLATKAKRRKEHEKQYIEQHISTIKRRCKRENLSEEETQKKIKEFQKTVEKLYDIHVLFRKGYGKMAKEAIINSGIECKYLTEDWAFVIGDSKVLAKIRETIEGKWATIHPHKHTYLEIKVEKTKKPTNNTSEVKEKAKDARKAKNVSRNTNRSKKKTTKAQRKSIKQHRLLARKYKSKTIVQQVHKKPSESLKKASAEQKKAALKGGNMDSKNVRRRKKVYKRKIANIAARSREFTVSNIKKNKPLGAKAEKWKNPKDGYKQPKRLHKKFVIIHKETGNKTVIPSEYPNYTLPKMNKVEYMEKLVQYKLNKWDKKNPMPTDDMFKEENMVKWKAERQVAEERIRDFVVSVYDKLKLIGRFKKSEDKYEEKLVAEIKDTDGTGHKINESNPNTSKVLKKAQSLTHKIHKNNPNLVSTNLKDHKQKKGRIILPDKGLKKAA